MPTRPSRPERTTPRLLSRGSRHEARRLAQVLRRETVGGALLLLATVVALVWANSPWSEGYVALREARFGPSALHLNLSAGAWAADGLLAVFFFVAGLELKRELVAGDLRDRRRAALPVAAALGGMAVPALIFVLVNLRTGDGALRGWAVPTATDIAFALAVLAVIGAHLPVALRTFLLTLAVVDDLLAIVVIAVFFTAALDPLTLLLALLPLLAFGLLVRRQVRSWWLLLPLAATTWALVHASGVHATVAGVALALTVPVASAAADADGDEGHVGLAEHFEHRIRPLSAGLAVPLFAFLSAGVAVGGVAGLRQATQDPIAIGIVLGLVVGKTVGVLGATVLMDRFTPADLDENLDYLDVLGLSLLAGIGFTVALLIGELAFGPDTARGEHAKVAVLAGSLVAACLAAAVLRPRNRVYRRMAEAVGAGEPEPLLTT